MKKNKRLEERRKHIPEHIKKMVNDKLNYGECPHFEGCVAKNNALKPEDCSACPSNHEHLLNIPCVSVNEVAVKLSSFLEAQKDCPPEILDAVNKEFWNLI